MYAMFANQHFQWYFEIGTFQGVAFMLLFYMGNHFFLTWQEECIRKGLEMQRNQVLGN